MSEGIQNTGLSSHGAETTTINMAGLGKLGTLPFEIVYQVLLDTDIRSLSHLKSVSKDTKLMVETIREFHTLLRCTQTTIRYMAAVGVDGIITCRDLYNVFCRPKCDVCDEPGCYLYLLACHRLCETCLARNPRYRPLRPMQAACQYDIPLAEVRRLPMLQAPLYSSIKPFKYFRRPGSSRWRLIDREVVRRHSMATHRSEESRIRAVASKIEWIKRHCATRKREKRLRFYELPVFRAAYTSSIFFNFHDLDTGETGIPYRCIGCPGPDGKPMYMTKQHYERHVKALGYTLHRQP